MNCQTATFPAFGWDATVDAEAITDGATTSLSLQFSNLPGIAPVAINGLPMTGEVVVEVDGVTSTVTLTGSAAVTAAPNAPVPVPPVVGILDDTHDTLDVTVKSVAFTVSGLTTKCPVTGTGDWALDPITVEDGTVVVPTPTDTASPTPTATPTDEPTDKGNKKGTPAKGKVSFSCVLQELGSPFDYKPTVTMSGSRASADDSKVSLRLNFSKIPGLAPLPIENGRMKVTAKAEVGGKKVSFAETSTVNAPSYGEVAVPTMTASITTDEDELDVEITGFDFDFGEMAGVKIYSECKGSGKLSKMVVGIGDDGGDDPGDTGDTNTTSTSTSSLPKTGSGAPLLMFGLWASAFVLLGGALFLFLPRRRNEA